MLTSYGKVQAEVGWSMNSACSQQMTLFSNQGLKLLIAFAVVTWSSLSAHAQGTVRFQNIEAGYPLNAPVYMSDGVTKLSGTQFTAELLGGVSPAALAPIATTPFLTGNGAGYFLGGIQTIMGVAPLGGTAWVVVEVWNTASGASFDQARASGLPNSWWESGVFSVQMDQFNGIPLPGNLTGLGTSPVYLNGAVPEPSSITLVCLGAAVTLLNLRRHGGQKSDV